METEPHGLDAFPEYPRSLLVDILRVAERAARDVPVVDPTLDAPVKRTLLALEPLSTALRAELDPELKRHEGRKDGGPVALLFAVSPEGLSLVGPTSLVGPASPAAAPRNSGHLSNAFSGSFRLATPPDFREQRIRFYDGYVKHWNAATDTLAGARPHKARPAATVPGLARVEEEYAELAAAFAAANSARVAERFIPTPERDDLALRYLAYCLVLAAYRATGGVGRISGRIARNRARAELAKTQTVDVLALALARAVQADPGFVEGELNRIGFDVWAETEARKAESEYVLTNKNSIRKALKAEGIIRDLGNAGRGSRRRTEAWAEALLKWASAAGWYR